MSCLRSSRTMSQSSEPFRRPHCSGNIGSRSAVRALAIARLRYSAASLASALSAPVLRPRRRRAWPAPRGRQRPAIRRTGVTEYWIETAASVGLDVGRADHLAPFLGFFGDQLAELDRRSWQQRAAEVSETGLHLGVVESRVDLLVELVDDLRRRGLRCTDAEPTARLVAGTL